MKYGRIRDLREDRDLTQKQMAEVLIAASGFTAIMSGAMWTSPTEILRKLAEFHHTSVDYLLGLTDENGALSPAEGGDHL